MTESELLLLFREVRIKQAHLELMDRDWPAAALLGEILTRSLVSSIIDPDEVAAAAGLSRKEADRAFPKPTMLEFLTFRNAGLGLLSVSVDWELYAKAIKGKDGR